MPTESIVFAPEIDNRALNKETKQINQQLEQSASNISPEFDQGGLDSLMSAGGGGMEMGGGGMGPGAGAGIGALASKIPKSVTGVTAAAALPVALAGGIGVGLLSAMHGASARLQTSTSLLGQAWNNVWRPMGDKLDQLFIRDPIMQLVGLTQDFEDTFRSGDWLVDPMAKAMGDIISGDTGGAIVNLGIAANRTAERLTGLEWPTLTGQDVVGGIGWPNIGAAVLLNPISWPAIGAGVFLNQLSWPTLTFENVMSYLTDPSKGGGGGGGGMNGHPGGPSSEGVHRDGRGRGEVVSGSEQNASGGGGGRQSNTPGSGGAARMPEVETRLDETNRRLRELKSAMSNMGIVVDGERIGRATQDARQNRISDTDPTVM